MNETGKNQTTKMTYSLIKRAVHGEKSAPEDILRHFDPFLLELTTGLRVGELMALQWDDLNLKTGELRIERQVYRTKEELLIQEPKTKASIRTVILPPPVVEALKEYKKTVSSRWMFPSPKKEDAPLAPAAASHRLSKILSHAGCKKIRFHDLRHPNVKPKTQIFYIQSRNPGTPLFSVLGFLFRE